MSLFRFFDVSSSSLVLFVQLILDVSAQRFHDGKTHQLCSKENGVSYLWRVRTQPAVYVFGTVHVADELVWPSVPENVKAAWRHSDKVYAELDWQKKETRQEVQKCRTLPNRHTLEEHLPARVFRKLRLYLRHVRQSLPDWTEHRHIIPVQFVGFQQHQRRLFKSYVGEWKRLRPIWVLLLVNDLTEVNVKEGLGKAILDEKLLNAARARGQETAALETAAEQCKPLNELNNSLVIGALNDTLNLHLNNSLANRRSQAAILLEAYNCGLLEREDEIHTEEQSTPLVKSFNKAVKRTLVRGRNKRLAKRVNAIIKDDPNKSLFFAMGVAHLLGRKSVLSHLRELGYKVEHIDARHKLSFSKKQTPPYLRPPAPVFMVTNKHPSDHVRPPWKNMTRLFIKKPQVVSEVSTQPFIIERQVFTADLKSSSFGHLQPDVLSVHILALIWSIFS